MTTTFETAQVENKVFDIKHGWGFITKIFPKNIRPITVQFSGYTRNYMFTGKYSPADRNQVLFWDEVRIIAPEKPLPKLEVDTKVLVWDLKTHKFKAHFSHFDESGRMYVFAHGTTSWSVEDCEVWLWEHWELVKD